ncbi:MAG: PilZ domain-containing protein [Chloroflexi bacterium]|nr:PilZ domain-containing protein [Chloroflexota bacterium]
MPYDERRTEPRAKAASQIMFECFRHGTKISQGFARTINLSEHGALVETPCAMDLDSSLILSIHAPFYLLVIQGNVVHSRQISETTYHIGVRLINSIEGNWDHLKKDVQKRLQQGDVA